MSIKLPEKIVTETVMIGDEAFYFEITNENITRYGRRGENTSEGLLVRKHYQEVVGILYISNYLRDSKTKESLELQQIGTVDEREVAPTLEKVLDALTRQLSLLTNGEYDAYFENCRKRHDGEDCDDRFNLPFEMEVQDIFWHILDLREGKYF